MSFITSILSSGLFLATPLMLAALGEIIMEKAGVIDIALEGKMLVAAFAALLATYYSGSLLLGVAAALIAALLFGILFGVLCVTVWADQIIVGAGLNMLALGVTGVLLRGVFGMTGAAITVSTLPQISWPYFESLPVLGPVFFQQNVLVYLALGFVPVSWLLINRSRLGLGWRAVGENPAASDAAGLPVQRLRFVAILCGSGFCGLAGAFLSTAQSNTFVENMTAGRGFIALAIVIFARWQPFGALGVAWLFGTAWSLQFQFQAIGLALPHQFFLMLPYVLTLLVAVIFGRRVRPPSALAKPYYREG